MKGQRIDVDSTIRTRSRAKQQAEQWQMVPLPAKLLSVLTDTVCEAQALKTDGKWPALHGMPSGAVVSASVGSLLSSLRLLL